MFQPYLPIAVILFCITSLVSSTVNSQQTSQLIAQLEPVSRKCIVIEKHHSNLTDQEKNINYQADKSPTFFEDGSVGFVLSDNESDKKAIDIQQDIPWKPTRYGRYDVWIYFRSTGKCRIEASLGVPTFGLTTNSTNGKTIPQMLGSVYIEEDKQSLGVKINAFDNGNVALHSLILVPTCEKENTELKFEIGRPALLHSKAATVVGKTLRYEPKPEKNTLGYWVNVNDQAFWDFEIQGDKTTTQTYEVEILQGCGKDNGGSKVQLTLAKIFPAEENEADNTTQVIDFEVIDTGHWQNFEPRTVGTAKLSSGKYRLQVTPKRKAKTAVMDLRQIQLKPTAD